VPPASLPDAPVEPSSAEPAPVVAPQGVTQLPITDRGALASSDGDTETIDGVACPVDPMERLQCESCQ
jgi:ribonucleoside-diphosphate reductase alpha chain